jgi:hypothetical protein
MTVTPGDLGTLTSEMLMADVEVSSTPTAMKAMDSEPLGK